MKLSLHYSISLGLLFSLSAAWAQPPVPPAVALTINGRLIDTVAPALLLDGMLFVADDVLASELGLQVRREGDLWRLQAYGRSWELRPGERTGRLDDRTIQLPCAPIKQGDRLYVPLEVLREPLRLVVTEAGDQRGITSPAGQLLQVRQGIHPDRVRFVFDLAGPASYRVFQEPGKLLVEMPAAPDQPEMLRLHQFEDTLASQVTESVQDGFLRVAISHDSPEPPQLFTLEEPSRLVVDLLRQPAACEIVVKPVAPRPTPSDIWSERQFVGSKGPVRAFVVRFNPATTSWSLQPALAGNTIMQRATVSRIAGKNSAYAAINGGFFAAQGSPLGMLMIAGEWIKAPLYSRAVLGITRDGRIHIANVDFEGKVEFEGRGMLPVDRLNEGHVSSDSIVVFTNRWGPLVVGAPDKTRLAVSAEGVVTAIYPPNTDVPMPPGGYVISGNGLRSKTLGEIAQGTKVKLNLETNPRWPDLWQAIGGGPLLISDGKISVNGHAERFRSDVTNGCRPRSAVGLTGKGEVMLVAVEEPGMTLGELAKVMLKMGATRAMNLDGGGSTAIVVNGRLLNVPGDGCERAVSNALLVVKSGS